MTFKLFGTAERRYWKTIFESSNPTTSSINISEPVKNTVYKIWAVGGGGGGSNSWNNSTPSESACAGGGSGGYAYVLFDNTSGQSRNGNIQVWVGKGGASAYTTGYYDNITAGNGVASYINFPKLSTPFDVYAYTNNNETLYTDTTNYPDSCFRLNSEGLIVGSYIILDDYDDGTYIEKNNKRYLRDSSKDRQAVYSTNVKLLTVNGGTGGATGMDRYGTAGTGGTATVNTSVFTFVENSTITGKSGTAFGSSYGTATGGESLYLVHGKGGNAGPGAAVESGSSGYVRIDKESDASDYTYMEEKITNIKLANDFGVMKGYKEPTSSGGAPEPPK